MRRVARAAVFLIVCPIALAQMRGHHGMSAAFPQDDKRISPCRKLFDFAPAVLQPEFQKVAWPAITGDSKSQRYLFFSQAMTQYFGLNYEEAMRNFKGAKEIDKTMAMASWGIALAAGSNINLTLDDDCHELAQAEINCAYSLAGGEPQKKGCEKTGSVTPLEKQLIAALKERYAYSVADKATKAYPAAQNYSKAMAEIWDENKGDHNISALYAESMMDLHPWDLYDNNGEPKEWTPEIVEVLKTAIGDSPEDIGANHYYIHGIEGSKHPQNAKLSADLLQVQVKKSGHLVHMSSHIYMLLGLYEESLNANENAVDNDVDQYAEACRGSYEMYKKNDKCPQLYYGHYLSHDYFFGSVSATFMGRSKEAMKLACATSAHAQRFVIYEPGLQRYLNAPLMTMVVNRNWNKILEETKSPDPSFEECYRQAPFTTDSGCYILRSIYYWARGMAHATLGDADKAATNYADMLAEMKKINEEHPPITWGNNFAVSGKVDGVPHAGVLGIAQILLNARIQWARRELLGTNETIKALKPVVSAEDKLAYDEPPQWFTPVREALGGLYLQVGKYVDALAVFEEELVLHPKSGRALYGKVRALQGLRAEQTAIDKARDQFCAAWQYADYTMMDADLWPPDKPATEGTITCPPSEKQVLNSKPSECTCLITWPPTVDSAGRHVKDLECSK